MLRVLRCARSSSRQVAYGLTEDQMRRWGLYVSRPLGPEESITLFSGGRAGTPATGRGGLGCVGPRQRTNLGWPCRPLWPAWPAVRARALHSGCAARRPVPRRRAGPVPDQPRGPAPRHGLLQRQLRPPRPKADRAGWVPGSMQRPCWAGQHRCAWQYGSMHSQASKGSVHAAGMAYNARLYNEAVELESILWPHTNPHAHPQVSRWCRTVSSPSAAPTTEQRWPSWRDVQGRHHTRAAPAGDAAEGAAGAAAQLDTQNTMAVVARASGGEPAAASSCHGRAPHPHSSMIRWLTARDGWGVDRAALHMN